MMVAEDSEWIRKWAQAVAVFLDKVRNVKASLQEMRRPEKPLDSPIPDDVAGITRFPEVVSAQDARKVAFDEIKQSIVNARPENQVIPFSELPPAQPRSN